jgi:prepilin-type N-terminal cleavage/methylation domain-containing protein
MQESAAGLTREAPEIIKCIDVRTMDRNGFTLVELAIVLVIVGLLVGMSVGMLSPLTKRVKLQQTRDTVSEVYSAIIGYAEANKKLPADLTVLSGKLRDAYGQNLIYYPAGGITGSDLCTTQGSYLTVSDQGTTKSNVAFVLISMGENVCNQTGSSSPFTISVQGSVVSCPGNSNAGYDDIVKYQDINYLREQICNPFRIVTDSLPTGTEEVAYPSSTLQATDGTPQLSGPPRYNTWSISSGSLPPGLSLSSTGSISGTPISDGTYNFSIAVSDAEGRTASRSFSITINPNDPSINTDVLHFSYVGTAYTASIAASGGTGSYTWAISSGSLPPGLSLSGGSISGTPTTTGTYAFTVRITDGAGRQAEKSLSIAIND